MTKKPAPKPALDDVADHRRRLIGLRDRLTAELATTPAAYLAAIARQLQAVLAELRELPPPAGTSRLDELARQRIARLEAQGVPLPPRRTRGGGADPRDPLG